jgi:hypothetical protein
MKTFLSFTTGLLLGCVSFATLIAFFNDATKDKTKELLEEFDKAD